MKIYLFASEFRGESSAGETIVLRPQEISLTASESRWRFDPFAKQFVATAGALHRFGIEVIQTCLALLQEKVSEHGGLDYLQVFLIGSDENELWIIEDDMVVTVLLPSEY